MTGKASERLGLTRQVAAGGSTQGFSDAGHLATAASTLDETARSLRSMAGDLGITGASADVAWEEFTALAGALNTNADHLTQAGKAAHSAQVALQAAQGAFEALPSGTIDGWEKGGLVVGGAVLGGLGGGLLGDALANKLAADSAAEREAKAQQALDVFKTAMTDATGALPRVDGAFDRASDPVPADSPSPTLGTTSRRSVGAYVPSRRAATLPMPVDSGSWSSGAGPVGGAVQPPASGDVASGSGSPTGGGGASIPGGAVSHFPGTAGGGSADGSVTGTVPGIGVIGGPGPGWGAGPGAGGPGSSAGYGGAGGALAGGVAIGGAALGASGLGRAGGVTSVGAGAFGGGVLGGGGLSGAGSGGRSGVVGASGSGLVGGSSSATGAGGAASGSRAGATAGGTGMPMGGSGGGGASKDRRGGSNGLIAPDLGIEDPQSVAALGAGARAGSRGDLSPVLDADLELDDEGW